MEEVSALSVGKLIKECRKFAGFTQFELAEIINIDERQMSKIERGVHYPSLPTFFKLVKVLQIDINKFCPNITEHKISSNKNKLLRFARNGDENEIKLACKIIELINDAKNI